MIRLKYCLFLWTLTAFHSSQAKPSVSDTQLIILDFDTNPQQVIKFSTAINSSTVTKYRIQVNESSKYKFTLALENMVAWTCTGETGSYPYVLVEQQMSFETTCLSYVNYKSSDFQEAYFFWTGNQQIKISAAGSWGSSDEAQFVTSVFQEVSSCAACPNNTFCCEGGSSCKGEPHPHAPTESTKSRNKKVTPADYSRCIPLSLMCNGHPNCGKICNADESRATCDGAVLRGNLKLYFLTVITISWKFFYKQ